MTAWEYKIVETPSPATFNELQEHYNKLGQDGWELAGFNYGGAFFKRPLPPKPPTATIRLAQEVVDTAQDRLDGRAASR